MLFIFLSQTVLVTNEKDPLLRELYRNWSLGNSRSHLHASASLRVQINLGEFLLVLRSPILIDDPEFYLAVYSSYLAPQLKDTGEKC